MRPDRAEQILGLCDSWIAAATPAGGGLQIGDGTEQYRLRVNGIWPHDLNYVEVRATCLGLTHVLLRPGLNTVIDWDHQWFWSWCGEILAGAAATYFPAEEREIKDLFGLACRASIAGIWNPDAPDGFEEMRRRSEDMESNAAELVRNSHVVLVYLAFPVLEAVCKKANSCYMRQDGTVIQAFSIPERSYNAGGRCSSLRDMLSLLRRQVATPDLAAGLDDVGDHLHVLEPSIDPFELLYLWRNSSLHGSASLPTIGGTLLNVAALIALDAVANTYEDLRTDALERVERDIQTSSFSGVRYRSPWSYYPPYH